MVEPLIYVRCQQTLIALWDALDHRRIDPLMDLLSPDIRWQRERWYEGKPAVRAALEARPAGFVIRHVLTNLLVDRTEDGLVARMLMVPQNVMATADATPPHPAKPMARVGELVVKLSGDETSLLVEEIAFGFVFKDEA